MNHRMPAVGQISDAFKPLEQPRLFSVYRKLIQDYREGREVGEVCDRLREIIRKRAAERIS